MSNFKDVIDLEEIKVLWAKKVAASVVKCGSRYNYYRVRYAIMNRNAIEESYLRHIRIKLQEHIVKQNETKNKKGVHS